MAGMQPRFLRQVHFTCVGCPLVAVGPVVSGSALYVRLSVGFRVLLYISRHLLHFFARGLYCLFNAAYGLLLVLAMFPCYWKYQAVSLTRRIYTAERFKWRKGYAPIPAPCK